MSRPVVRSHFWWRNRLMTVPKAVVLEVVIKGNSSNWVTYNAKVSLDNPNSTPIPISSVSYTLETDNRVISSGEIEERQESLPKSGKILLEVPMKVAQSQLMRLYDLHPDWNIIGKLDLRVIIAAGHTIFIPPWEKKLPRPTP